MDRYLDAQLERLGTDHIDYYLVHALTGPAWDRIAPLGVVDFLAQAGKDGRIRNAGFSFHGNAEDFVRIVDAAPWSSANPVQLPRPEFQAGTRASGMRHPGTWA
jgi:predicted aldo/keto reductase-like oxidoreductase